MRYDRELLLSGAKRNSVLELWEVQQYGADSFADPDYVSIYGLRPPDWFARGIRLLGRTAVECTRDELADAIGKDIAAAAGETLGTGDLLVIDPFAGSGNTLYWILHHLPGARGIGFELDDTVFELTSRNLATLGLPIEVVHDDYSHGVVELDHAGDERVVAVLAPPWGDALDRSAGLDLRRTTPPICELVDVLIERFTSGLLCAIQIYEHVDTASLAEVERRFDWSTRRTYPFNSPGENHGVLLGTKGWVPRAATT